MITDQGQVKLIDFGLSKDMNSDERILKGAGTPYYMAPEVYAQKGHDIKADIWSMGVLIYVMLSGVMPFSGKTTAEIRKNVTQGHCHFEHKSFERVSPEAKELILQMLQKDPKLRPQATQVLAHPWFKKFQKESSETHLAPEVFEKLRQYQNVSQFKRLAMNLLIKMTSDEQLTEMREQFRLFDTDSTGLISCNNLKQCIESR